MEIKGIKIVKDSGWELDKGTSRPQRGINDFNRELELAVEATDEVIYSLCQALQEDKDCPGWTGVTGKRKGEKTALFRTTWDSSD